MCELRPFSVNFHFTTMTGTRITHIEENTGRDYTAICLNYPDIWKRNQVEFIKERRSRHE